MPDLVSSPGQFRAVAQDRIKPYRGESQGGEPAQVSIVPTVAADPLRGGHPVYPASHTTSAFNSGRKQAPPRAQGKPAGFEPVASPRLAAKETARPARGWFGRRSPLAWAAGLGAASAGGHGGRAGCGGRLCRRRRLCGAVALETY
jgi:hypothetical protein